MCYVSSCVPGSLWCVGPDNLFVFYCERGKVPPSDLTKYGCAASSVYTFLFMIYLTGTYSVKTCKQCINWYAIGVAGRPYLYAKMVLTAQGFFLLLRRNNQAVVFDSYFSRGPYRGGCVGPYPGANRPNTRRTVMADRAW